MNNSIAPGISSMNNSIAPGISSMNNSIAPSISSNLEVIIYSEDEDGNQSIPVSLSEGAYNAEELNDMGIINDGIFKIDLPSGLMVTLFSDDLFTGTPYIVTSSSSFESYYPTYSIIVNKNLINSNSTKKQSESKKNMVTPNIGTVISSLYNKFDIYIKNNFKIRWIKDITNTNLIIIISIIFIFLLLIIMKKRRR
jgi:hypothetical protein